MVIPKEVYRHFRLFLKKNGLYTEFMTYFKKQPYGKIHRFSNDDPFPNYMKIMDEYSLSASGKPYWTEFRAMFLIFRSFAWGGVQTEWDKRWATVGLKWALYCIKHNIKICTDERLGRLIKYWERSKWIEIGKFSFKDRLIIQQLKYKDNGDLY